MDAHDPRRAFGEALRAAVANRGLSLARVQAHLAVTGHSVALSTLSQWQHGRRVPASPRSFAVVEELERVLRVTPGLLRGLVEPDSAGSSTASVVTYDAAFARLVDQLGTTCRRALVALGAHDRLRLDARGVLVERHTTMTMRVAAATDRYVVAYGVETGGDVDLVTVRALRGCRLGRVLRDPEAEIVAVEVHFDRWLSPGDTVVYDIQINDANSVVSEGYFRWSSQETTLLVTEATFDRDFVPTQVSAFHQAHADGPDLQAHELTLEHGDRVHVARHSAEPGLHGIRWTWPDPCPITAE
ncbi:helix-turn-helix domain-containing protein [Janibacter limosus]|uniref:helix-turn-helix domain-containing protein n=1 Tax=Janibacter limosus TaxID=53458 RepID=UPI00082AAF16|nr:helix-turn-helix transcriptional regulator [Janibacter limosus]